MTDYERIEQIIRYLDTRYREQPTLKDLARVAGLSEFHFHRLFARWAGTTPKNFLKALTAEHAKQLLLESKDLLSVSLDTGLSGPSRLHDLMIAVEGVTPGEFKTEGRGVTIQYGIHPTPFGPCLLAATPRGVCHLSFMETPDAHESITDLQERWPQATIERSQHGTASIVARMFNKGGTPTPVSLLLAGTPFQLKVWKALLAIPDGHLVSYSAVASAVGHPGAARAVGSAVGKNPIAVLIPCHRVIRETGVVGDYHWGTMRKKALLAWEFGRSAPPADKVDSYGT
ncbi:MAG TPA: methylated-DNA--[protein]-cysteine S-methyltransferase [Gemmatimonadaceae bacterium]|jgi:AraC family transcriptional regulator of adaptative response/methylated-DNA-[protein]-cysteine methyltransferase|nr:methylated-DNA--[protein]-cysteine S-methyltransferase [Gemmatimonadaceae bacterium]